MPGRKSTHRFVSQGYLIKTNRPVSSQSKAAKCSPLLANRLRAWRAIAGDGFIARSYGPKKALGTRMARDTVSNIIRKYGKRIGLPSLSPDDLRHTYARLAYDAGVPPTLIKELLGQGDITTTYRYIGLKVDLDGITGDFVPLWSDQE